MKEYGFEYMKEYGFEYIKSIRGHILPNGSQQYFLNSAFYSGNAFSFRRITLGW